MHSITLGSTNQYVHVTAESTGNGSITCTFLNQQDIQTKKSCHVLYGQCAKYLAISRSNTIYARDNLIIVPLDIESDIHDYCYATIANNGTFSVLIEGTFSSTLSEYYNWHMHNIAYEDTIIVWLLNFYVLFCSMITAWWYAQALNEQIQSDSD